MRGPQLHRRPTIVEGIERDSPTWVRIKRAFGERLRRMRRERGVSARNLGKAIGIAFNTVTTWENGRVFPRMDLLFRIAGALDCTLVDLLPDELHQKVTSL